MRKNTLLFFALLHISPFLYASNEFSRAELVYSIRTDSDIDLIQIGEFHYKSTSYSKKTSIYINPKEEYEEGNPYNKFNYSLELDPQIDYTVNFELELTGLEFREEGEYDGFFRSANLHYSEMFHPHVLVGQAIEGFLERRKIPPQQGVCQFIKISFDYVYC